MLFTSIKSNATITTLNNGLICLIRPDEVPLPETEFYDIHKTIKYQIEEMNDYITFSNYWVISYNSYFLEKRHYIFGAVLATLINS